MLIYPIKNNMITLSIGTGCFWTLQAGLDKLKGVYDTEAGYVWIDKHNNILKTISKPQPESQKIEVVRFKWNPFILPDEVLLQAFMVLRYHEKEIFTPPSKTPSNHAVFILNDLILKNKIKKRLLDKIKYRQVLDSVLFAKTAAFLPAFEDNQCYAQKNTYYSYVKTHLNPKLFNLRIQMGKYWNSNT